MDAEDAQAQAGGPLPFPLSYTGEDRRLRWTVEPSGIVIVITRPYREVAILRQRLLDAERELLALNGRGVDRGDDGDRQRSGVRHDVSLGDR